MTITGDTPWRDVGGCTAASLVAEFGVRSVASGATWMTGYVDRSPLIAEADAIARAAGSLGRLLAAMSLHEQQHATVPDETTAARLERERGIEPTLTTPVPNASHNFLSFKLRHTAAGVEWRWFDDYAACAAFWRDRLLDPAGPYAATRTIRDLLGVYAPASENDLQRYVDVVCLVINRIPVATPVAPAGPVATGTARSSPAPSTTLNMTKGLIPYPTAVQRIIGAKPAGVGWDDLGPRSVKGIVLHRMQGTLQGTYDHFSRADVGALTDFGMSANTGELWQYNDYLGRRSGWASGKVVAPYGDGKAFVDAYGLVAVNRDEISLEFDRYFLQPGAAWPTEESPITAEAIAAAAAFIAPHAHDYGIPWDVFPIAPQDGFSFIRWHQEFTIGTGKVCPGRAIMDATPAMIDQARELMRRYQTGEVQASRPARPAGPTTAQPTVPPTPPTALVLPMGVDLADLAGMFGSVTLTSDVAMTFAFDPDGPVTALWLAHGNETGEWPQLATVGRGSGGRLFRFEGGYTIVAPPGGTPREVAA